eukprot:904265-Prymnesium_polylepis.1
MAVRATARTHKNARARTHAPKLWCTARGPHKGHRPQRAQSFRHLAAPPLPHTHARRQAHTRTHKHA